ncbi:MAG: hypothetical protein J5517_06895 [Eubacterium sp.]|nr:hypothetical protein [Eubacterium sp.]
MKRIRRVLAVVLALAIAFSINIPLQSQAKTKYYWEYETNKHYFILDGKWFQDYEFNQKFDKNGLPKYQTSISYLKDYENDKISRYEEKTVFKYDKKENMIQSKYYDDGVLSSYTKYTYDSNGLCTKEKVYDANKKLVSTTTYKRDSHENLTKQTTKYTDKKKATVTIKISNTYKKGKLVKYVSASSDGYTCTCTFYSNGNDKKYVYEGDGYKSTTNYDKYGRETKYVSEDEYFNLVETYKYKNKKDRNPSEIKRTHTIKESNDVTVENIKRTYESKKDKNGNLLEWIVYENGEPYSKEEYSGYKKFKAN